MGAENSRLFTPSNEERSQRFQTGNRVDTSEVVIIACLKPPVAVKLIASLWSVTYNIRVPLL